MWILLLWFVLRFASLRSFYFQSSWKALWIYHVLSNWPAIYFSSKMLFRWCYCLVITTFLVQESTVHGVRYFIDGENAVHKFAWVVIMVCSVRSFIHGLDVTELLGKSFMEGEMPQRYNGLLGKISYWNFKYQSHQGLLGEIFHWQTNI